MLPNKKKNENMGIDKLKRVMWRIREMQPGKVFVSREYIQRAIMLECGTWPLTIRNNRKALIRLGWLRTRKTKYELTDKDLGL